MSELRHGSSPRLTELSMALIQPRKSRANGGRWGQQKTVAEYLQCGTGRSLILE